jgi:hypothetical protein
MVMYLAEMDPFFKKRPNSFKKPRINIHIYTEGDTEQAYFDGLNHQLNGTDYRIQLEGKKPDVYALLNNSQVLIKDLPSEDSIWIIFDYEDNKYTTDNIIKLNDKVIKINKSSKAKIHLIISNPCFELWVLLHYEFINTKLLCAELKTKLIEKWIPNYKKGTNFDFTNVYYKTDIAVKHAKQLINYHKEDNKSMLEKEANPCTNMYKFLEFIEKIKNP